MKALPLILFFGKVETVARNLVVNVPLAVVFPRHPWNESGLHVAHKLHHGASQKIMKLARLVSLGRGHSPTDTTPHILCDSELDAGSTFFRGPIPVIEPAFFDIFGAPLIRNFIRAWLACGLDNVVLNVFCRLSEFGNRLKLKARIAPFMSKYSCGGGLACPFNSISFKNPVNARLGNSSHLRNVSRPVHLKVKRNNLGLLCCACFVVCMSLHSQSVAMNAVKVNRLNSVGDGKIADAVFFVEGGARAKVPYGILSIKVRDTAHARLVCLATIRNNRVRWIKAGQPGAFLDYLADKYCPRSADPVGNKNWKANIKRLVKE